MTRVNRKAERRVEGGERVEEIDYRLRRKNKALRIEACPKCGKNGKRIDLTMTRGPEKGRVRVWFQHLHRFVDYGCMKAGRDGCIDCFMWKDEHKELQE